MQDEPGQGMHCAGSVETLCLLDSLGSCMRIHHAAYPCLNGQASQHAKHQLQVGSQMLSQRHLYHICVSSLQQLSSDKQCAQRGMGPTLRARILRWIRQKVRGSKHMHVCPAKRKRCVCLHSDEEVLGADAKGTILVFARLIADDHARLHGGCAGRPAAQSQPSLQSDGITVI